MTVLRAFFIAFSMYSRIPVPHFVWQERDMRYALCFFPAVGAVIAVLSYAWLWLCGLRGADGMLRPLVLLCIPLAVTGGIHLDGFMDTSDALSSFRGKEEKLAILKDSHIGAFAVIRLLGFVLLFLAGALVLPPVVPPAQSPCLSGGICRPAAAWTLLFVLARSLSGIAVVTFPAAKKEGVLYTFAQGAARLQVRCILVAEALLCAGAMCMLSPLYGGCIVVLSLVCFVRYLLMSRRQFGGISGDLAGWFVCTCELWGTVAAGGISWLCC